MYRKIKGFVGNVPLRLIATVLLAILVPSLLVTSLGLLAVYQADTFVHDRVTLPYRQRLREVQRRARKEWKRVFEEYQFRLRDAHERGAHLARLREEGCVLDILISDGRGLHRVPSRPPYPELWTDQFPPELTAARRLEFSRTDWPGALATYRQLLDRAEDDAVVVEALLGAARTSVHLGAPEEAVRYLTRTLERYGNTVDGTGVLRKLPLLCRKLEIESLERLPGSDQTARRLVLALREESDWLDHDTVEFYRRFLAELAPADAMTGLPALERTPWRIPEDVLDELEPILVPEPRGAEAAVRFRFQQTKLEGKELTFVSFPTRQSRVEVHLALDRQQFLSDLRLFAAEAGLERDSILFARVRGDLVDDAESRKSGWDVAAIAVLPPPFEDLEIRYAPPPGTLPPGFRSFDVITLATFTWAVIVLVLTIIVGVFFTLRSVLREMATARLKTDFVSFISHELKTPLAAIRMFTETLRDPRFRDEDEKKQCLEMIEGETERLTTLINKVIEYSRLERHQKAFRFTPCDIEEVVRTAVELFHTHHQDQQREIEVNSAQRISRIMLDRESMIELILNLLSNAGKYSAPDRGIVVNLRESVDEISVDVVDQGFGIPKREQKRIFDKFFRSHDYLSRELEGMGLGLALARYIAKVHNGDIKVTSQVNSGSTFSLRLKKTHVLAE